MMEPRSPFPMPRNTLLIHRGDDWRLVTREEWDLNYKHQPAWDFVAVRYDAGDCKFWPHSGRLNEMDIRLILAAVKGGK